MPRKMADITGQRFGRLTVIEFEREENGHYFWRCVCDCGNIISMRKCQMLKGKYVSCGCWFREESRKYNTYDISGSFGIGYFNKGGEFYFDMEDYEKIKEYCWCLSTFDDGRPKAVVAKRLADKGLVIMHRLIMGNPRKMFIDHIDRNPTNNRKENLRIATPRENGQNKGKQKGEWSSKYIGVSYRSNRRKWRSQIYDNSGKYIHLGYFISEIDAAVAYNKKAEELGYLTRNIIE